MSGNFGPRMPLHVQNADIAKAAKDNPSYESFRPNVVHPSGGYRADFVDNRATVAEQYRIRRYPNGQLAYWWVADQIIDAIHKLEFNGMTGNPNEGSASLLPLEAALLTVVFPAKYREMEPMQAEILTQLSPSEKEQVAARVFEHFANEKNWNAGFGGGSQFGSKPRNVGG